MVPAAWHRESVLKLMDEIDSYIPDPERALDKPFQMSVEDVFTIQGRGTVVTGRVEQGIIKVGQEVEVVGMGSNIKTAVTGTWFRSCWAQSFRVKAQSISHAAAHCIGSLTLSWCLPCLCQVFAWSAL